LPSVFVVEEGAEFGAGQLGRGVGDRLHQRLEVEGRGQLLGGVPHQLQHAGLVAQRLLGAEPAQRFPDAARAVFQQVDFGGFPALRGRRMQRHHGLQARRHPSAAPRGRMRCPAPARRRTRQCPAPRATSGTHTVSPRSSRAAAEGEHLERHHASRLAVRLVAVTPLFADHGRLGRLVDGRVDRHRAGGIAR
jgi:hypothetical protein